VVPIAPVISLGLLVQLVVIRWGDCAPRLGLGKRGWGEPWCRGDAEGGERREGWDGGCRLVCEGVEFVGAALAGVGRGYGWCPESVCAASAASAARGMAGGVVGGGVFEGGGGVVHVVMGRECLGRVERDVGV